MGLMPRALSGAHGHQPYSRTADAPWGVEGMIGTRSVYSPQGQAVAVPGRYSVLSVRSPSCSAPSIDS
eukprot:13506147-Alexandrium_andersonii.AAC.1